MHIIKGFVSINSRAVADHDRTSVIGQLTARSRTFAREKSVYSKNTDEDLTLTVFSSVTSANVKEDLTQGEVDASLELASWVDSYIRDNGVNSNSEDFKTTLAQRFPDYQDWAVGDMLVITDNHFPESIEWVDPNNDSSRFTLWFSDASFQAEYDVYEILVVPPTANVDDLLESHVNVQGYLAEYDVTRQIDRANDLAGIYPYTALRSQSYTWQDADDGTLQLDINWYTIIYGPAGDRRERIQDAIIEYVNGRTTGTDEQWQSVLPDLFSPTEFMLIPLWDQFSVPSQNLLPGIHSPFAQHERQLALTKTILPDFEEAHITTNLSFTGTLYRSLGMLTIGSPNNRDLIYRLEEHFPDYMLVSTSSTDFARISPKTQGFITLLYRIMAASENLGPEYDLPLDMVVKDRDGKRFVASSYQGIYFLVMSRESYLEVVSDD